MAPAVEGQGVRYPGVPRRCHSKRGDERLVAVDVDEVPGMVADDGPPEGRGKIGVAGERHDRNASNGDASESRPPREVPVHVRREHLDVDAESRKPRGDFSQVLLDPADIRREPRSDLKDAKAAIGTDSPARGAPLRRHARDVTLALTRRRRSVTVARTKRTSVPRGMQKALAGCLAIL